MKLVIDIPDGCYEELNNGQFPVQDAYRLVAWIKNGTPQPEKHTEERTETHACDLVSRQAVIDTIETDCSWDIFNEWGVRTPTGESIINAIKSVPSVEQEKCGDCISRQAVIDRINKLIEVEKKQGTDDWGYGRERVNAYETMLYFVKSEYLHPSVEPERPHGKWIMVIDPDVNAWTGGHTCSECGRACVQMSMNYCANCGAKMEVHDGKENS